MYQAIITEREAGQRLDKYLHRILPDAGSGFLYKMLRKKNITLNDKKADGSEKIAVGDCVKIFFAQETLAKFMGKSGESAIRMQGQETENGNAPAGRAGRTAQVSSFCLEYHNAYEKFSDISVIYENDHILLLNKPAGILSQKASVTDLSLNEWLIGCLLAQGNLSEEDLAFYKPSVCNRLDRNTSGMVLCARTLQGAQLLGGLLKDRTLHKYYQLYVKGHIEEERLIEGYLVKDEKRNKVTVKPASGLPNHSVLLKRLAAESQPRDGRQIPGEKSADGDGLFIRTWYKPLRIEQDKTLLEVELITGKPHQIRAHLASIGHPLLGDYKYGDRAWNETYRRQSGVQSQLLHAYRVVFPPLNPPFADLSERVFTCEPPEIFGRVVRLT